MQVISEFECGTLYIRLSGEMDEYSASSARAQCDKLLETYCQAQKAVINLSALTFMDSSGIGFLIGRYKKAARLRIPLFVDEPNLAADKILKMSGIYTLIPKAQ